MQELRTYLNQDVIIGVFFILLTGTLYFMTKNLITEAAVFPIILILLMMLFSISIIINGRKRTEFSDHGDDEEKLTASLLKGPLITIGGILLYCLLITLIGFFPSTVIFLVAYLYLNNYRSIKIITITVVTLIIFIYILFVYQLNVKLPAGILFE